MCKHYPIMTDNKKYTFLVKKKIVHTHNNNQSCKTLNKQVYYFNSSNLLLNSFYLGLHFGEIKFFSCYPLIHIQNILAGCFKVGGGIVGLCNEDLEEISVVVICLAHSVDVFFSCLKACYQL